MAELIDDIKIVLGQCVRVHNTEKKQGKDRAGAATYVAMQVEDENGDNERCLLFTETEFTDMEFIRLPESIYGGMKLGRLYPAEIAKHCCYLVKSRHWNGGIIVKRISITQLTKADNRAAKHPESCTKKSLLTDLMD